MPLYNPTSSTPDSDATVTFTDITTNNSSTSKHGFLKKLDNTATNYMDGTGAWSVPPGAGVTGLSYISMPTILTDNTTTANKTYSSNTTQYIYQFFLPYGITVNKISLFGAGVTVAGTYDLTIYSEDGQTQKIAVTTASISGSGIQTTAVSAVVLAAGVYWFGFNTNGTANGDWAVHRQNTSTSFNETGFVGGVTSEPILCGTATITAGTPKATFTPSSTFTANILVNTAPAFRLDN